VFLLEEAISRPLSEINRAGIETGLDFYVKKPQLGGKSVRAKGTCSYHERRGQRIGQSWMLEIIVWWWRRWAGANVRKFRVGWKTEAEADSELETRHLMCRNWMEAETRRNKETRSCSSESSTSERTRTTDPTWSYLLDEARVGVSFCHVETCLWGQVHCQGPGLSKGTGLKLYQFAFVKNPCEITQKWSNSSLFLENPAFKPLNIRHRRLKSGEILRCSVLIFVI